MSQFFSWGVLDLQSNLPFGYSGLLFHSFMLSSLSQRPSSFLSMLSFGSLGLIPRPHFLSLLDRLPSTRRKKIEMGNPFSLYLRSFYRSFYFITWPMSHKID